MTIYMTSLKRKRWSGGWQYCSICSCLRWYLFLFKASGKGDIFIVRRAFIWIVVRKLCIYWTQYTDNGLFTFVLLCFRSLNVNWNNLAKLIIVYVFLFGCIVNYSMFIIVLYIVLILYFCVALITSNML